jgi:hypothetical protein
MLVACGGRQNDHDLTNTAAHDDVQGAMRTKAIHNQQTIFTLKSFSTIMLKVLQPTKA